MSTAFRNLMEIQSKLGRELQAYRTEVQNFSNMPYSLANIAKNNKYTHATDLINKLSVGIIEDYAEILKPSELKEITKVLSTTLTQNMQQLIALTRKHNLLQTKKMDEKETKRACDICGANLQENRIKTLKFSLQQDSRQHLELVMKQLKKESGTEIFTRQQNADFQQLLFSQLKQREQVLLMNDKRIEQFIEIMNGSLVELKKINQEIFSGTEQAEALDECKGIHRIKEHVSEFLQTSFEKKIPPWIHSIFERLIRMYLQARKDTRKDYGIQVNNSDQIKIKELKEKLRQNEKLNQIHKQELKQIKQSNEELTAFKDRTIAFNIQYAEGPKPMFESKMSQNVAGHKLSYEAISGAIHGKKKTSNLPSINKNGGEARRDFEIDQINGKVGNKGAKRGIDKQVLGNRTEKNKKRDSIAELSGKYGQHPINQNPSKSSAQTPAQATEKLQVQAIIKAENERNKIKSKMGKITLKITNNIIEEMILGSQQSENRVTTRPQRPIDQNENQHLIARKVLQTMQTKTEVRLQQLQGHELSCRIDKEPNMKISSQVKSTYKDKPILQEKPPKLSQTQINKQVKSSSPLKDSDYILSDIKKYQQFKSNNISKLEVENKSKLKQQVNCNNSGKKLQVPSTQISKAKRIAAGNKQILLHAQQSIQHDNCCNKHQQRLTKQIYEAIRKNCLLSTMDFTEFKTLIEEERAKDNSIVQQPLTQHKLSLAIGQTSVMDRSILAGDQTNLLHSNNLQFKEKLQKSGQHRQIMEEKLKMSNCNSDQQPSIQSYGEQCFQLFGSKVLAYRYEKSMIKNYHRRKNRQLSKQQITACHQIFDAIECLKANQRDQYNQLCSLIRYPYQSLYNDFEVINFVTDMKFETFEFYFKKICAIHRKCEREQLTCRHIKRFLSKIESYIKQ